jgi:hypothetical protein
MRIVLIAAFLTSVPSGHSAECSASPDKPAPAKDKSDKGEDKPKKPKFTISKETTYVTEPVDKDGHIDYVAALNKRLREGVTPANNANAVLIKALGPQPEGKELPAEFFKWLEVPAPPKRGDYFIDLKDYTKDHLKLKPKQRYEIDEQLGRAMQRPWTEKQYPHLAAWLKANQKPLALVDDAVKRTHYFWPLLPMDPDLGLMSARIGSFYYGMMAKALTARAMLRTSQGATDAAWQDLLACLRLGRLVGRGGGLTEGIEGYYIGIKACRAQLAWLEASKPDAKRIAGCLRDLQKLPPLPGIADKVDQFERFMFLDSLKMVDKHGLLYAMETFEGLTPTKKRNRLLEAAVDGIDWDPAMKSANRWYDRWTLAMRENDRGPREKKLRRLFQEVSQLRADVTSDESKRKLVFGGPATRGKVVGDILLSLIFPAMRKSQITADQAQQTQDNLLFAFALAAYQRDHGSYPKKLDDLAPKYLANIPPDLFTSKPLVYRPGEKSYLLYSFGVNGKDDGGRGSEDDPPGDDLSVRMPLPELPKK